MNLNSFDSALYDAKLSHVQGAEELWSLYMSLADNVESEDLMAKIDSYIDGASSEARTLYLSIAR